MSDLEDLTHDAEQDDLRVHLHENGLCGGPDECSACEDDAESALLEAEEREYWADRPLQRSA